MNSRSTYLALLPLIPFLLALNPYFIPGHFDAIAYYSAAKNLVGHGVYEFEGAPIAQWPPGFAAMLALVFLTGFDSVWAAKLVVLACAAAGMVANHALFRREDYLQPALVVLVAWLLPETMHTATSVMSEIPFTALALVFLYTLHLQRTSRRGVPVAVLSGVLLGLAALTRTVGVVLGAAVLVQAIMQLRHGGTVPAWRRCLPEAITGFVGAAIFTTWVLLAFGAPWKIVALVDDEPPRDRALWEAPAVDPWSQWSPLLPGQAHPGDDAAKPAGWDVFYRQPRSLRVLDKASDLLFRRKSLMQAAGFPPGHPVRYLFMVPLVFVAVGAACRLRAGRGSPSDAYALAMLVLLGMVGWHETRYWVPIAPFLAAYLFEGVWRTGQAAARRFRLPGSRAVPASLLAGWLLFLAAYAADRLWRANSPQGPLCYLASPRASAFYRGSWGDLHRCCTAIREEPGAGAVAFAGKPEPWAGYTSLQDFAGWFCGREILNYPPARWPAFLLVAPPNPGAPPWLVEQHGLELIADTPDYKAYRVPPARPDQ